MRNKTIHFWDTTCFSFCFFTLSTKFPFCQPPDWIYFCCLSVAVRTHICCVQQSRGHRTEPTRCRRSNTLGCLKKKKKKKKVACQGWELYHRGFSRAFKKRKKKKEKACLSKLAAHPGKCAAHGGRSSRASVKKKKRKSKSLPQNICMIPLPLQGLN